MEIASFSAMVKWLYFEDKKEEVVVNFFGYVCLGKKPQLLRGIPKMLLSFEIKKSGNNKALAELKNVFAEIFGLEAPEKGKLMVRENVFIEAYSEQKEAVVISNMNTGNKLVLSIREGKIVFKLLTAREYLDDFVLPLLATVDSDNCN